MTLPTDISDWRAYDAQVDSLSACELRAALKREGRLRAAATEHQRDNNKSLGMERDELEADVARLREAVKQVRAYAGHAGLEDVYELLGAVLRDE